MTIKKAMLKIYIGLYTKVNSDKLDESHLFVNIQVEKAELTATSNKAIARNHHSRS